MNRCGYQLHSDSCIKKSKLTNLMEISRIEGYNGKYRLNPQGIRKISNDLFEFDQIGSYDESMIEIGKNDIL